jgi:hypothetical protein
MSGLSFAIRTGLAVLLIATLADRSAEAQSYAEAWSAPGSTGVVDESSLSLVSLNGTSASFRASAPAGSVATIRYSVTSLSPIDFFGRIRNRIRLTLAFQKNEDGAYASAMLKRIRLADGAVSLVASINSLELLPGSGVQIAERTVTCASGCFLADDYAYFIEVVLWKPYATNAPRVVALRVRPYYGA